MLHRPLVPYAYPPGSKEVIAKDGYVHCLNEYQAGALETLQQWIVEVGLDVNDLCQYHLHPVLTLLRYLRSTGFDHELAADRITKSIAWRRSFFQVSEPRCLCCVFLTLLSEI